jgi:hypothetical protein
MTAYTTALVKNMLNLSLPTLTVLVPLLNFFLMVCFSNYSRSWRHLSLLVIGNMLCLLFALFLMFPAIARGETFSTTLGSWILSGLFEVNWVFAIDALTYTMLLVVLTVSTLVHLYSTEYMSEDPHTARFISYLSLFTFFMLILVTANNFVSLFLGWEGVGLCSYLLISFWFTRIQANKAAIKAMVVNRVSDLFFTVGIIAIFFTFQTVEFNAVFALAPFFVDNTSILVLGYEVPALTLITFLLFLGAMGKSAQIGLHTWLPDAMEGWLTVGLSIKKILPYAGITSLDTLVSGAIVCATTEKSNVNEVNPQETDISLSGSSETLRKTASPFNFTPFFDATQRQGGDLVSFLEWLVGFTEGGGSFIVDKTGYVSFQLTQSYRDVQILYYVRQTLGFGSVSQQDAQNNTWRFRVRDKVNLQKIIFLFNGNLVFEKNRVRFIAFVNAYNTRYKENIEVSSTAPCVTLNDAWLSGFTDAEGCFTVSVIERPLTRKKPYQVQARFILAQKNGEKELISLCKLVGGRLSFQKSYSGHNLSVQISHLKVTLRYFRQFPLKTIKRISLIKFLAIYRPVVRSISEKRPLTSAELSLIRRRAKEINKIVELVEDKVRPTE